MSDDNNNVDMDRYFSDPDYRKEILKKREAEKNPPAEGGSRKMDTGLKKKLLLWALGVFGVLFLILAGYVFYLFQGLPSLEELENPKTAVATEVRSRDGVVLDRYFIENRTYVPIDRISPNIVNALVATEDHRFFDHWGIDSKRL